MTCEKCGEHIDPELHYVLQLGAHGQAKRRFCSLDCVSNWCIGEIESL